MRFAAKWNAFCRKMESVLPQNGKRFAAKWNLIWPKTHFILAQNTNYFGPKRETFWAKMQYRTIPSIGCNAHRDYEITRLFSYSSGFMFV